MSLTERKGPLERRGEQSGRRSSPVRIAVVAIVASGLVLTYLTWKYYGVNGALFIAILITFALFRVLRTARAKRF